MKLLTRDNFRESVFERDGYKCVICGVSARDGHMTSNHVFEIPHLSAHHIIERRLWTAPHELGGYFIDNGATLCETHHIQAEQTVLTCNQIREAAGITKFQLPEHLYDDLDYDKWSNILQPNGTRLKGELFFDESVQKILKSGGALDQFVSYVKYPRTHHVPWSHVIKDDKMLPNVDQFIGQEVVVTLKMDGENCLDGHTKLDTNHGILTFSELTEIKNDDLLVSSLNIETNKREYVPIEDIIVTKSDPTDDWYEIEVDSGETLRLTGKHLVWLPVLNCYRRVVDLNGDETILLEK